MRITRHPSLGVPPGEVNMSEDFGHGSCVHFSPQRHACAVEFKEFPLGFSKAADVHDVVGDDSHFVH